MSINYFLLMRFISMMLINFFKFLLILVFWECVGAISYGLNYNLDEAGYFRLETYSDIVWCSIVIVIVINQVSCSKIGSGWGKVTDNSYPTPSKERASGLRSIVPPNIESPARTIEWWVMLIPHEWSYGQFTTQAKLWLCHYHK